MSLRTFPPFDPARKGKEIEQKKDWWGDPKRYKRQKQEEKEKEDDQNGINHEREKMNRKNLEKESEKTPRRKSRR